MKTAFYLLAFSLIGLVSSKTHALELTTNITDKNVEKYLREIEAGLPANFSNNIEKKVKVVFRDFNKSKAASIVCGEEQKDKIKLGGYLRGSKSIVVDNIFLRELEKGDRQLTDCPHPSVSTLLKATIIHELAHMYDHKMKNSKDAEFLNIAGRYKNGLIIKRRKNLNEDQGRSPDPYEFKNGAESFAVNMEHFLMDPNYKCRRPTFYEYYSKKLNFSAHENEACQGTKKLSYDLESVLDSSKNYGQEIDLTRLYQVHYLFAGKGEQMMSRFGHAMIRLVICAPNKKIDESCLSDVSHHVVLSFRANVDDMSINYLKGLTGKYSSQLFIIPFSKVVDEYTKGELREVTSLPLKLDQKQKERFVQRALENVWSYKGKYYFLTNNCAVESLNLMKVGVGSLDSIQQKNLLTPNGLFNYLIKDNLADASAVANKEEARIKGLYFPSAGDKALKSMRFLNIKEKSVNDFMKKHNARERRDIYLEAINSASERKKAIAHALRLEDTIATSVEIQLKKFVVAEIFSEEADVKDKELQALILEVRGLMKEINKDIQIKEGYGIPLESEIVTLSPEMIEKHKGHLKEMNEKIMTETKELFKEQLKEQEEIAKNLYEIKTMLVK